jgi:hypothetical protein
MEAPIHPGSNVRRHQVRIKIRNQGGPFRPSLTKLDSIWKMVGDTGIEPVTPAV